jgi:hypothetical protein
MLAQATGDCGMQDQFILREENLTTKTQRHRESEMMNDERGMMN